MVNGPRVEKLQTMRALPELIRKILVAIDTQIIENELLETELGDVLNFTRYAARTRQETGQRRRREVAPVICEVLRMRTNTRAETPSVSGDERQSLNSLLANPREAARAAVH